MGLTHTQAEFKKMNRNSPIYSVTGELLVVGCNYHTTWQKHRNMRFVLTELKGNKARLQTRNTRRNFWTDTKDLIFINSSHNKNKAKDYLSDD